ncbi:MAG: deoxyguanosinetriphosphate triphosphohydrolase [Rhodospirillales bacterium]
MIPSSSPPASGVPQPGLAPYATRAAETRGRLHAEPASPFRSVFQRDRDRVIHSTAFRRLKHKTQVFVYHEGDHYRTRLTHSIEVAQIARTLARCLGIDEDLAEVVALAHDLGHTPFGHTGEDALQEVMAPYGGFDHNAQTLRLLTSLEQRYAGFDGLNLTWETLEGVVKHNGPLTGPNRVRDRPLPAAIAEYARVQDLELDTWPGLEAQVAALADDIAYNSHDIDDGLRANLFPIADLRGVPLIGDVVADVEGSFGALPMSRFIGETMRRTIDRMVSDLLTATRARLAEGRIADAEGVRRAGRASACFSPAMAAAMEGLRAFLHARMYRHERVNRVRAHAARVVGDLFRHFLADPARLPEDWRQRAATSPGPRLVADYIAGMTDKFALETHARLFGGDPPR